MKIWNSLLSGITHLTSEISPNRAGVFHIILHNMIITFSNLFYLTVFCQSPNVLSRRNCPFELYQILRNVVTCCHFVVIVIDRFDVVGVFELNCFMLFELFHDVINLC